MPRLLIAAALTLITLTSAVAAPLDYRLETSKSEVGFVFTLNKAEARGRMPVRSAKIIIDPEALTRSSVDVTVDAARARTGFFFATEAMKAASVLNTRAHPTIRFRSTRIRLNGAGRLQDGAKIDGELTIRGVTRPVTLNAALFRQAGTEAGDLSKLSFRLSGVVDRMDFNVAGYPDLVDEDVKLEILARVSRN